MEFPDEEKIEFNVFLKEFLGTFLINEEKVIFDKFINLAESKGLDFFEIISYNLYEKNNILELDINSTLLQITSFSKSLTKEEEEIFSDFFNITPSILAIFSEMIGKEGSLSDVLNLEYFFLNHLNKVNNRFGSYNDNEELKDVLKSVKSWQKNSKNKVSQTKEKISFQKELEVLSKNELKTEKTTPILEWKGHDYELTRLSRKLYEEKLTKKPTSFENLCNERIPTEWKGSIHCLAYFLYSLKHSFENNPKIIASDGAGYMKTALFYFTNCESKLLSQQKYDLSDLAYKVKNTKSRHLDTKRFVDKIIKETFQPK